MLCISGIHVADGQLGVPVDLFLVLMMWDGAWSTLLPGGGLAPTKRPLPATGSEIADAGQRTDKAIIAETAAGDRLNAAVTTGEMKEQFLQQKNDIALLE